MPQSFPVITATTKLQDSLQPILDRDISARSNNSGTAFPTTDLDVGMLCYRTDLGALYVLKQVTPTVTWEPLVQSTGAGGSFLALAGGTMVGNIGFTATAVERRIIFTTGAGNNNTYLFGRPSDNVVGFYNSQNTTSVWEYAPASNTFNVAATNFTKGGQTVWHAGNDGVGSGLDADLLDGQDSAFYRNYNNLTNRPTLGTAAAINTADIAALVDLSSRVAKAGDTMTGALTVQGDITASSGSLRSQIAGSPTTGQVILGNGSARLFYGGTSFDLNGALAVGGNITNNGNQVLHLGMNGNTVGSYIWAVPNLNNDVGTLQLNATIAGSNLTNFTQTMSGTWRCMGRSVPTYFQQDEHGGGGGFGGYTYTLWQRIA